MIFAKPLIPATWLQRHHRFLVDVRLDDGRELTAHSGNTGSMRGCSSPGMRVWLSDSENPRRKYRHSLELVEPSPGVWVGVNTQLPNKLVHEAIRQNVFDDFADYQTLQPEVRYGDENSRIDWLLRGQGQPDCYLEVKNVTLCEGGLARFPDAVTTRGSRHLRELMRMREKGFRAAVVFCVQHSEARCFAPAVDIDPVYAETLREAQQAGVEIKAWKARISPREVALETALPIALD
jgi:sugar fermentation stimulation protein A